MKIVETSDGSHSLYSEQFGESYHSRHGAMTESMHVFIKHGIEFSTQRPIRIFEVGFGTGLNAWLSWIYAEDHQIQVHYTGIELYPVPDQVAASLNHGSLIPAHTAKFKLLHTSKWEENITLSPLFTFCKKHQSLTELTKQALNNAPDFDVIFFDAFAPDTQPELWTVDIFKYLFQTLAPGGCLVTYSSKSSVRRAMTEEGFQVEKLPGPPHKREMLRAVKK